MSFTDTFAVLTIQTYHIIKLKYIYPGKIHFDKYRQTVVLLSFFQTVKNLYTSQADNVMCESKYFYFHNCQARALALIQFLSQISFNENPLFDSFQIYHPTPTNQFDIEIKQPSGFLSHSYAQCPIFYIPLTVPLFELDSEVALFSFWLLFHKPDYMSSLHDGGGGHVDVETFGHHGLPDTDPPCPLPLIDVTQQLIIH